MEFHTKSHTDRHVTTGFCHPSTGFSSPAAQASSRSSPKTRGSSSSYYVVNFVGFSGREAYIVHLCALEAQLAGVASYVVAT